ncbi:hypothetical protein RJZ57_001864 [Blastomyces gilchristii]
MAILVAQIIPMDPRDRKGCSKAARQLNRAIERWAPTKSTEKSPVMLRTASRALTQERHQRRRLSK